MKLAVGGYGNSYNQQKRNKQNEKTGTIGIPAQ